MAQVIEFYTPSHFKPKVRLLPQEQSGKVIAFMSHREEAAEIVCASAHEGLRAKSSFWLDSGIDEYTDIQASAGIIIFQTSGSCMIPENSYYYGITP
jgi:hypothetical protein